MIEPTDNTVVGQAVASADKSAVASAVQPGLLPPIRVKRTGRKSKINEEIIEKICILVRAGNYIETASAYAGIDKQTLYSWMRKGAAAKSGIYKRFSDALLKACAEAELRDLQIIANAAAGGQWQAAAWRLERRAPSRWGRRDFVRAEHSGADGGPIRVEQSEVPIAVDRLRQAVRDLVRRELECEQQPKTIEACVVTDVNDQRQSEAGEPAV